MKAGAWQGEEGKESSQRLVNQPSTTARPGTFSARDDTLPSSWWEKGHASAIPRWAVIFMADLFLSVLSKVSVLKLKFMLILVIFFSPRKLL